MYFHLGITNSALPGILIADSSFKNRESETRTDSETYSLMRFCLSSVSEWLRQVLHEIQVWSELVKRLLGTVGISAISVKIYPITSGTSCCWFATNVDLRHFDMWEANFAKKNLGAISTLDLDRVEKRWRFFMMSLELWVADVYLRSIGLKWKICRMEFT